MAQLELVLQPWLMYESTANLRVAPSGKQLALGSALVGALARTMMARRATAAGRIFMMIILGCDDFDEGDC